jgi:tetratricopeptide (TPR) repeat protein
MRKSVGLLLLAAVAWGGDPAEEFEKGLASVRDAVADGRCALGKKRLDALLAEHAKARYAVGHRLEIQELMKQIVFGTTVEAPDPKKLVSGDLIQYDAHVGTIRIRYAWDRMGDWHKSGDIWVHPAVFDGPHSITIKGEGSGSGGIVIACFKDGGGYAAAFGGGGYLSAISHIDEKGRKDLATAPSLFDGSSYTAKLTINRTAIQLASGNRSNLRCPKRDGEWGTIAFGKVVFKEVLLSGKVESSWIQGLVDAERQKRFAEFEKTWEPKEHLPDWLFAEPSETTVVRPDGREWPCDLDEESLDLLERAMQLDERGEASAALGLLEKAGAIKEVAREYMRAILLGALGRHLESEALCRKVREADPDFIPAVHLEARELAALGRADEARALYEEVLARYPGSPDLHAQAALFLGWAGRWEEAEKIVRDALAAGGTSESLEAASHQVHKAVHGPPWAQRHEYTSPHYQIYSDMDTKVCFEASKILEQAYAVFVIRLERAPTTNERFKVFLFSGEAGYQQHVLGLFGSTAPHTAGLYAPGLRQLFIWNLREREEMMQTVRHEGFHQYLDRIMDNPPLWFNEGLAEYFEEAKVINGKWTTGAVRRDHLALLEKPQPLSEFLFLDNRAFMKNAFMDYAEAWAFIHFLLHTTRENHQLFDAFWDAFKTIPAHADAIRTALGDRPIRLLDEEFRAHLAEMAGEK